MSEYLYVELIIIMGIFTVINGLVTVWGLSRCSQRELAYQKQLYEQIHMLREQRLIEQAQFSEDFKKQIDKQYLDYSQIYLEFSRAMIDFKATMDRLNAFLTEITTKP